MTYMQAQHILDQARDGIDCDDAPIDSALELLGDSDHIAFSWAAAPGLS